MWKRLRRRTMGPGRPAVFADQWPLLVFTALVLVGSIVFVAVLFLGG